MARPLRSSGDALSIRTLYIALRVIIPALLTPGELVFSPAAVNAIGVQKLLAMNQATTAAEMRRRIRLNLGGLVTPVPSIAGALWANFAPLLARFNAASSVSNATTSTVNNQTFGPSNVTINAGNHVNERQLARMVSEELGHIQRRSR